MPQQGRKKGQNFGTNIFFLKIPKKKYSLKTIKLNDFRSKRIFKSKEIIVSKTFWVKYHFVYKKRVHNIFCPKEFWFQKMFILKMFI